MDRSHLDQKHMKNVNCLQEFVHKRFQNVYNLHQHMPGVAFFTGQLQWQWCSVGNPTIPQLSVFQFIKDSEQTKSKMLVFCIVLIFTRTFMTFGIFVCWIDDKRSQLKHDLHAWQCKISDFQVFQGNAATHLRCGGSPNTGFVGNLLLFAALKEVCKSAKNWQKL